MMCRILVPFPGIDTRYDRELREPLMWRQGSQVSMRMARGSVSLLSSHGRGWLVQLVLLFPERGDTGKIGLPYCSIPEGSIHIIAYVNEFSGNCNDDP